jgi:16S rRNA C967 or C1407 C5-methylase (RsmB/RsmF family)
VIQRLRDELPGYHVVDESPLPIAVFIRGNGGPREAPIMYDDAVLKGREVIVGMMAGQAMLKGAELYVPGILASTKSLNPGDLVAVSIGLPTDPEKNHYGVSRMAVMEPHVPLDDERFPHRRSLCIGIGEILLERQQMTKSSSGMAMVMRERLNDLPALPQEFMQGLIMHQAFPSLLAACVLAPAPGSMVLDMCASPGGKTTALAQLMENRGRIYAIDRTNSKVIKIEELARTMGSEIIVALKGDASTLYNAKKSPGEGPSVTKIEAQKSEKALVREERRRLNRIRHGHDHVEGRPANVASDGFGAETFDHILLDAPCSALGVRPRFLIESSVDDLIRAAKYSRSMLEQAVHLLKQGGTLVFSTCTLSPLENEANVRFILDKFPCMKLVEAGAGLHHGSPGLTGRITVKEGVTVQLLSDQEAKAVQRWDPEDGERSVMGFFICKMQKRKDKSRGDKSWNGHEGGA